MHIQSLTAAQSLASLHTSAAGLTASEAQRRLAEFGPNHVEELGRESLLLRFAREFTHFFAIILWLGAALAFLAEHFDPGQILELGTALSVASGWQRFIEAFGVRPDHWSEATPLPPRPNAGGPPGTAPDS